MKSLAYGASFNEASYVNTRRFGVFRLKIFELSNFASENVATIRYYAGFRVF